MAVPMNNTDMGNTSDDDLYGDIDAMFIGNGSTNELVSTTQDEVVCDEKDTSHVGNVDDMDLYDDLILEETQNRLESYEEMYKKLEEAIRKINSLQSVNKALREEAIKQDSVRKNVQNNFASLLVTARGEITRKEKEILQLRKKLMENTYSGCTHGMKISITDTFVADRNLNSGRTHGVKTPGTDDKFVAERDLRSGRTRGMKTSDTFVANRNLHSGRTCDLHSGRTHGAKTSVTDTLVAKRNLRATSNTWQLDKSGKYPRDRHSYTAEDKSNSRHDIRQKDNCFSDHKHSQTTKQVSVNSSVNVVENKIKDKCEKEVKNISLNFSDSADKKLKSKHNNNKTECFGKLNTKTDDVVKSKSETEKKLSDLREKLSKKRVQSHTLNKELPVNTLSNLEQQRDKKNDESFLTQSQQRCGENRETSKTDKSKYIDYQESIIEKKSNLSNDIATNSFVFDSCSATKEAISNRKLTSYADIDNSADLKEEKTNEFIKELAMPSASADSVLNDNSVSYEPVEETTESITETDEATRILVESMLDGNIPDNIADDNASKVAVSSSDKVAVVNSPTKLDQAIYEISIIKENNISDERNPDHLHVKEDFSALDKDNKISYEKNVIEKIENDDPLKCTQHTLVKDSKTDSLLNKVMPLEEMELSYVLNDKGASCSEGVDSVLRHDIDVNSSCLCNSDTCINGNCKANVHNDQIKSTCSESMNGMYSENENIVAVSSESSETTQKESGDEKDEGVTYRGVVSETVSMVTSLEFFGNTLDSIRSLENSNADSSIETEELSCSENAESKINKRIELYICHKQDCITKVPHIHPKTHNDGIVCTVHTEHGVQSEADAEASHKEHSDDRLSHSRNTNKSHETENHVKCIKQYVDSNKSLGKENDRHESSTELSYNSSCSVTDFSTDSCTGSNSSGSSEADNESYNSNKSKNDHCDSMNLDVSILACNEIGSLVNGNLNKVLSSKEPVVCLMNNGNNINCHDKMDLGNPNVDYSLECVENDNINTDSNRTVIHAKSVLKFEPESVDSMDIAESVKNVGTNLSIRTESTSFSETLNALECDSNLKIESPFKIDGPVVNVVTQELHTNFTQSLDEMSNLGSRYMLTDTALLDSHSKEKDIAVEEVVNSKKTENCESYEQAVSTVKVQVMPEISLQIESNKQVNHKKDGPEMKEELESNESDSEGSFGSNIVSERTDSSLSTSDSDSVSSSETEMDSDNDNSYTTDTSFSSSYQSSTESKHCSNLSNDTRVDNELVSCNTSYINVAVTKLSLQNENSLCNKASNMMNNEESHLNQLSVDTRLSIMPAENIQIQSNNFNDYEVEKMENVQENSVLLENVDHIMHDSDKVKNEKQILNNVDVYLSRPSRFETENAQKLDNCSVRNRLNVSLIMENKCEHRNTEIKSPVEVSCVISQSPYRSLMLQSLINAIQSESFYEQVMSKQNQHNKALTSYLLEKDKCESDNSVRTNIAHIEESSDNVLKECSTTQSKEESVGCSFLDDNVNNCDAACFKPVNINPCDAVSSKPDTVNTCDAASSKPDDRDIKEDLFGDSLSLSSDSSSDSCSNSYSTCSTCSSSSCCSSDTDSFSDSDTQNNGVTNSLDLCDFAIDNDNVCEKSVELCQDNKLNTVLNQDSELGNKNVLYGVTRDSDSPTNSCQNTSMEYVCMNNDNENIKKIEGIGKTSTEISHFATVERIPLPSSSISPLNSDQANSKIIGKKEMWKFEMKNNFDATIDQSKLLQPFKSDPVNKNSYFIEDENLYFLDDSNKSLDKTQICIQSKTLSMKNGDMESVSQGPKRPTAIFKKLVVNPAKSRACVTDLCNSLCMIDNKQFKAKSGAVVSSNKSTDKDVIDIKQADQTNTENVNNPDKLCVTHNIESVVKQLANISNAEIENCDSVVCSTSSLKTLPDNKFTMHNIKRKRLNESSSEAVKSGEKSEIKFNFRNITKSVDSINTTSKKLKHKRKELTPNTVLPESSEKKLLRSNVAVTVNAMSNHIHGEDSQSPATGDKKRTRKKQKNKDNQGEIKLVYQTTFKTDKDALTICENNVATDSQKALSYSEEEKEIAKTHTNKQEVSQKTTNSFSKKETFENDHFHETAKMISDKITKLKAEQELLTKKLAENKCGKDLKLKISLHILDDTCASKLSKKKEHSKELKNTDNSGIVVKETMDVSKNNAKSVTYRKDKIRHASKKEYDFKQEIDSTKCSGEDQVVVHASKKHTFRKRSQQNVQDHFCESKVGKQESQEIFVNACTKTRLNHEIMNTKLESTCVQRCTIPKVNSDVSNQTKDKSKTEYSDSQKTEATGKQSSEVGTELKYSENHKLKQKKKKEVEVVLSNSDVSSTSDRDLISSESDVLVNALFGSYDSSSNSEISIVTFESRNGNVDRITRDREGDKITRDREGEKLTRNRNVDKITRDTEGDKITKDREGDKITRDREGGKLTRDREGDKITRDREGGKLTRDTEGDKITKDREGDKITRDREGGKLTRDREGDKITRDREGGKLTRDREGDKITKDREGDKIIRDLIPQKNNIDLTTELLLNYDGNNYKQTSGKDSDQLQSLEDTNLANTISSSRKHKASSRTKVKDRGNVNLVNSITMNNDNNKDTKPFEHMTKFSVNNAARYEKSKNYTMKAFMPVEDDLKKHTNKCVVTLRKHTTSPKENQNVVTSDVNANVCIPESNAKCAFLKRSPDANNCTDLNNHRQKSLGSADSLLANIGVNKILMQTIVKPEAARQSVQSLDENILECLDDDDMIIDGSISENEFEHDTGMKSDISHVKVLENEESSYEDGELSDDESNEQLSEQLPELEKATKFFKEMTCKEKNISILKRSAQQKLSPSLPTKQQKLSPSLPTKQQKLRPSLPTKQQKLSPSLPTKQQKLSPSLPTKQQKLSPSLPTKQQKLSPSLPTKQQKLSPSLPTKQQKLSPSLSTKQQKLSPSLPTKQQKLSPSLPTKQQKLSPSLPTKQQKLSPSLPTKQQKLSPSLPTKQQKLSPSLPTKQQKLSPSLPTKQQKLSPSLPNKKRRLSSSSPNENVWSIEKRFKQSLYKSDSDTDRNCLTPTYQKIKREHGLTFDRAREHSIYTNREKINKEDKSLQHSHDRMKKSLHSSKLSQSPLHNSRNTWKSHSPHRKHRKQFCSRDRVDSRKQLHKSRSVSPLISNMHKHRSDIDRAHRAKHHKYAFKEQPESAERDHRRKHKIVCRDRSDSRSHDDSYSHKYSSFHIKKRMIERYSSTEQVKMGSTVNERTSYDNCDETLKVSEKFTKAKHDHTLASHKDKGLHYSGRSHSLERHETSLSRFRVHKNKHHDSYTSCSENEKKSDKCQNYQQKGSSEKENAVKVVKRLLNDKNLSSKMLELTDSSSQRKEK